MGEINALQKKLLEMLGWFHDFCVTNNLIYYAIGGTILGAKRHAGFIPWDDDIDIGMPRTDYTRLCHILSQKPIDSRFVLETPYTADPDYCFPFCKLYDTTTTLIENSKHQLIRGIYIDIFPIDGIGDTKEEGKSNYVSIKRMIDFLKLRTIKITAKRSIHKNILLWVIQAIPRLLISDHKLCQRIDKKCQKMRFEDKKWGGNLLGAWGFREVMETVVFGSPKLYKFENIMIFGPEMSDQYLVNLYGDWKKLPPKEKQISHHDYYLDLTSGYREKRKFSLNEKLSLGKKSIRS